MGDRKNWTIRLLVAAIVLLLLLPGCADKQTQDDGGVVAATIVPTTPHVAPRETIDPEDDSILKYETTDFDTGASDDLCDLSFVQGQTRVTVLDCKWDESADLRIGIRGENGVQMHLDSARGSLEKVLPDWSGLPTGKYTLYIENIGQEPISSVSLYYTIE